MNSIQSSSLESLAKADVIAVANGEVVRESTVKNTTERTLKCRSCDSELVKLMNINDLPTNIPTEMGYIRLHKQTFISNCPVCKDKSFPYILNGQAMIAGIEGKTTLCDVDTEVLNDEIVNHIKVM